ncbi:MAG: SulP family inorganic anion transporter [Clostridia bacterium]
MSIIKDFTNDLKKEFGGYNAKTFSSDLMAGLTVTAVALPLALAFGVSSGADAGSGLITAIIAGILMSVFAGGFYQISGPTGAMAAILLSLVAQHGMQGVFIAGVLAGIMLVLAGIFHLGKLTAFIPMPVVTGFTSGIAVIIALGQVDNLFGVSSSGETTIEKILSYQEFGFSPNYTTLLIGVCVALFIIFFPKKIGAIVPPTLLAIILSTAVSMIFKLDTATVGTIPQTLLPETRLIFTDINLSELGSYIIPAASIAMLAMIESLLCGASAGRMTGVKLKSDRELISQGIGNIVVPFFGGIPATAAIARTSVAIKSGAKTRVTGIIHGVGLLISMFVLAPVMSEIPLSALSGVLMVTAFRMNEWPVIKRFFKGKFKGAIAKFLVTMFATIIFDLTVAIVAGVALALFILVSKLSKLEISYDNVDMERLNQHDPMLAKRYSNTIVAYITGAMIFSNTDLIEEIPSEIEGTTDTILFSMRGVSELDISSGQTMYDIIKELQKKGVDVMFCGVTDKVYRMMQRTKIVDLVNKESFYWSAVRALGTIHERNDVK